MKRVRLSGILLVLFVFAAVTVTSFAAADYSGGFITPGVGNTGDYYFMFVPDSNDGDGNDYVCAACYTAQGNLYEVGAWAATTGEYPVRWMGDCRAVGGDATIVFGDPSSMLPAKGANSEEGRAWCLNSVVMTVEAVAKQSDETVTLEPQAGPDMVAMPAWSVMGAFTAPTTLYFAPEAGAESDTAIAAGQTLWVTGMDAQREFYQVVLSGVFLWAPASSIGPNYDNVWNGQPLPTVVVQ